MNFPNKLEVQRDTGGWPELVCLGVGLVAQVVRYEDAVFIANACNAAAPAAVVQAEPSEAEVSAAGRALADRSAQLCNVDAEDNWKIYGGDYIEDARVALIAARGAK